MYIYPIITLFLVFQCYLFCEFGNIKNKDFGHWLDVGLLVICVCCLALRLYIVIDCQLNDFDKKSLFNDNILYYDAYIILYFTTLPYRTETFIKIKVCEISNCYTATVKKNDKVWFLADHNSKHDEFVLSVVFTEIRSGEFRI